ncbi:MAG TPA: hypothetical protein PLF13_05125 [candidate division Zixibacteria bacterium]|nr:hypothetical protein [candidate division Zixibacteria bacterium]
MEQRSQIYRGILIVIAAFLITSIALADIPLLVNYQGRLADDNDQPVADDIYEMEFSLWNDSTSTSPSDLIWTSNLCKVEVVNGLFNYALGTHSSLTSDIFVKNTDLFLNVYVGGYGNLEPRQRITSVGFSFQSLFADTAYEVAGDPYLRADGDTLKDELSFQMEGGQTAGRLELTDDAANLYLFNSGHMSSILFGTSYGSLYLHQHDGTKTASLDSRYSLGGLLRLADSDGATTVELDGGSTGDNAAILPESSVNSDEMFNEPGIAREGNATVVGTNLENTYSTLESVEITLPGPGYVYLLGCTYVSFRVSTPTGAYVQVVDNTEETTYIQNSLYVYADATTAAGYYTTIPVMVDGVVYEEAAGAHTYYLRAKRTAPEVEGNVTCGRYRITAIYIPTSYGSVLTVASNPGEDPEATAVSFTDETGEVQTGYVTDLRYYELKAKEARLKALEAELELEKAREAAAERERID